MPNRNPLLRKILTILTYVIMVMLTIVIFVLGPRIEAAISPVVGAFRVTDIWQDKDPDTGETRYFISGAVLKLRDECVPTSFVMMSGGGFTDPTATVVTIDMHRDPMHQPGKLTSRPSGSQYWGPWRLKPPAEPVGPLLTIMVRHKCHALWELSQQIYTRATADFFPGLEIDIENQNNEPKELRPANPIPSNP